MFVAPLLMKNFKKYYVLPATPEEVYYAITNPLSLQLWTGEKAIMSTVPNTEFSLWDGSITGLNLEFEEHKKIVQQWYFGEHEEASIVTIKLHQHGEGTSVELLHTNIPDADANDIIEGWNNSFFAGLYEFFVE